MTTTPNDTTQHEEQLITQWVNTPHPRDPQTLADLSNGDGTFSRRHSRKAELVRFVARINDDDGCAVLRLPDPTQQLIITNPQVGIGTHRDFATAQALANANQKNPEHRDTKHLMTLQDPPENE